MSSKIMDVKYSIEQHKEELRELGIDPDATDIFKSKKPLDKKVIRDHTDEYLQ